VAADVAEETTEVAEEPVAESLTESAKALKEGADLEVSADEFEELIKSPEFQKPISDAAVRAMMNAEKDTEEVKESKSTYKCSNCRYEVEMDDDDYDGSCPNCHEHKGEFYKLEEGIFDKLKLTRAGKADWILANSMLDYTKATIEKGKVSTDAANKKFNTFVIVTYKDTLKNKKSITTAPQPKETGLVVADVPAQVKASYTEAEKLAIGLSKQEGNGPVFILLANKADDEKAVFLCQYFKGKLDDTSDTLEKRYKAVTDSLKGVKDIAKGGGLASDTKKMKVSEVKAGMQAKFKNGVAEVTEIKDSKLHDNKKVISVKFEDGTIDQTELSLTDELAIINGSITTESFDTLMAGVDELRESILETFIANSLVEAYGNVAGFKLTECAYLNNKFTVNGTIYFTSGNTRKTTYTFTESLVEDGKFNLQGLNEKLGLDKKFVLTGRIENKTLITESFKYNK
jgi:hypothetical protein